MSLWALLRIALRTKAWFVVAVSQLAGNAASRVVPGGAATGGVVQGGVLVRSGYPVASVGAVLSATGLLTTGMLFALPVLAVPAMLFGLAVPGPLEVGLRGVAAARRAAGRRGRRGALVGPGRRRRWRAPRAGR